jgi:hypothetical protein
VKIKKNTSSVDIHELTQEEIEHILVHSNLEELPSYEGDEDCVFSDVKKMKGRLVRTKMLVTMRQLILNFSEGYNF